MASAPYTLAICGPCGAGKSTLVRRLSALLSIECDVEPVSATLLRQFEVAPKRHALALQQHFIRARHLLMQKTQRQEIRLLDRTLDEDRNVFFKLHLALGFLSHAEYLALENEAFLLQQAADTLSSTMVLTGTTDVLAARMRADESHQRPAWLIDSLPTQMMLYRQWMRSLSRACVIDTTALSLNDLEQIGALIAGWMRTDRTECLRRVLWRFCSEELR
ncbi:MAG: deoxynucleoside kinase [Casimicrobium sp.]